MHQLSPDELAYWLDQHIRSRVHAVLAQPSLVRRALDQLPSEAAEARAHHAFILQASWEGRHAAMRWLIEFVGISSDTGGNIKSPQRRKDDLGIADLGGRDVGIARWQHSAENGNFASGDYVCAQTTSGTTSRVSKSRWMLPEVAFLIAVIRAHRNLLKIRNLQRFLEVSNWVQGLDLNQRPSGYEPDELPGCSTLQWMKGRKDRRPPRLSTPIFSRSHFGLASARAALCD